MKDRLERFVLLPFAAGCISESSILVALQQHTKRSKHEKHKEKTDGEEGCLDNDQSLTGQNGKANLPRFQKMFKNLSQIFVYKDEQEEEEMGMEIGLPTDVKHVSHIGLDGCTSTIFSKGWAEQELIDLHSFPLSELEFAIKAQAETPKIARLLETKPHYYNNKAIA